ncbi:MAG: tetratricopeptide repeat protein [Cytophagales bacterium]|nr:tetratricopeptide repeat protein [Cytophagales bacterium]MDW8383206.1 tetratricopeptide repeat protein [Flammeovirgaceae bacterium]
MIHKQFKGVVLFFFFIGIGGCQVYHDITSQYNAWFLANERMTEVENDLLYNPINNYSDVLQVLATLDTNAGKARKADMDYVIKMASNPIQYHPRSKWVDDCYNLIGKARLYQGDFENALRTFKYVNGNSTDHNARHTALNMMMWLFIANNEKANFEQVKTYIQRENKPFSRENILFYHLINAHYYRTEYKLEYAAQHLELALAVAKNKKQKTRLHFILAQIYERTGETQKALSHYDKVLKLRPDYEMRLYAKSMSYVLKNYKSLDELQKAEKFFEKKIKDDINFDYRDRLYYEYAQMMYKVDSIDKALQLLEESIEVSTKNKTQKAYSYLRKGEILYEKKNFELAAEYFNKALADLPETDRRYASSKEKAEVLQEFVTTLKKVQKEDRLLKLARMSEEEIEQFLNAEIEAEKEEILKKKEKERLAAKKLKRPVSLDSTGSSLPSIDKKKENVFPLYSEELLAKGYTAFIKKWGNRPLEDDWRRSNKPARFAENPERESRENENDRPSSRSRNNNSARKPKESDDIFASVKSLEERKAEIPRTPEELETSKKRLEEALFPLGKIYCYKLKEIPASLATFQRLFDEFPNSEKTPEALYIMYLICYDFPSCNAETYKNLLLKHYPESFYAKVIINPNYIEEKNAENKFVEAQYKKAFEHYKEGNYVVANGILQQLQKDYPKNNIWDKIVVLQALTQVRIDGDLINYFLTLDDFLEKNPSSEIKPFVEKLIKSIPSEIQDKALTIKRAKQLDNSNLQN